MLTLESVSYRYAGALQPSLHEVSLELRDGEALGLVGASESGKTTLCLVAAGLAPRSIGGRLYGRVVLDGVDAQPLNMDQLAAKVGIAFASPATQLSGVAGTVYEEVAFGPMNLGLPLPEVIERTEGALATLRIEALADRDPARLSGGQQQLVAIAGLLALRPKHIVLDEPTAQLDPAGTAMVAEALAGLARGGASILVAEHKTDLLATICARIAVLDAGRVVLCGPVGEILAEARLPELGVAPPAPVRIENAARVAGLPAASLTQLGKALAE
jgi:energy-coupling factor transporter ATP-binding protein EcfA2